MGKDALRITVNGLDVGAVLEGEALKFAVPPGQHIIAVTDERSIAPLELTFKGGERRKLWCQLNSGRVQLSERI